MIKTWQERWKEYTCGDRSDVRQDCMQAEIDEIRSELVRREAEIERFNSHIHTCGPTCTKAGCINARLSKELGQLTETSIWQAGRISELLDDAAAQRKVLEQALEALNDITAEISMKRFWREKDEKRFDEIADEAITAIQEQLA